MEKFLKTQKEFMQKATELIKAEKFTEVVEAFENQAVNIQKLEKSIEDDKEKIEKSKIDEEEKEKVQIKKYAEMFASAGTVEELITDLATVKEQLKKSEDRLKVVEGTSQGSSQPQEGIKKSNSEMSDFERMVAR